MNRLILLGIFMAASLPAQLTFTVGTSGITALACNGRSYYSPIIADTNQYFMLNGSTNTQFFGQPFTPTSDGSTFVQYVYKPTGSTPPANSATLRITFTAQANCTLQMVTSWTNNDPSNTLNSMTTIPLALTVGSDTIRANTTPQIINSQGSAAAFIQYTTASLAYWQDFSQPGTTIETNTWNTGATNLYLHSSLTVGVTTFPGLNTRYSTPILPGQNVSFTTWLRFGTTASTVITLAPEAGSLFSALYPTITNHPDRRMIGVWFTSQNNETGPNNPRGYNFLGGTPSAYDAYNPATGVIGPTFVSDITSFATSTVLAFLRAMNAQGVVIWDMEGSEFAQPMSYVGHPAQLASFSPEMATALPALITIFHNAGFRVGATLRSQQTITGTSSPATCYGGNADPGYDDYFVNTSLYTYPSNTGRVMQCTATNTWTAISNNGIGYQTAPQSNSAIVSALEADITAGNALGFDFYYFDSSVYDGGLAYPPSMLRQIQSDFPNTTIFPEEVVEGHYSASGPYGAVAGENVSQTSSAVRYQVPGSFSFIQAADKTTSLDSGIIHGIQGGDIYTLRAYFPFSQIAPMVALAAIAYTNAGSLVITDSTSSHQLSLDAAPATAYAYPLRQCVYFADSVGDLSTSTTYCCQGSFVACYQSGTFQTAGAILNLAGMTVYQQRYYDFSGGLRMTSSVAVLTL